MAWLWLKTVDLLQASWLQNCKNRKRLFFLSLWHQMKLQRWVKTDIKFWLPSRRTAEKKGSSVGTVTGVLLGRHLTWGRGSPMQRQRCTKVLVCAHGGRDKCKFHEKPTFTKSGGKTCKCNTTPTQSTAWHTVSKWVGLRLLGSYLISWSFCGALGLDLSYDWLIMQTGDILYFSNTLKVTNPRSTWGFAISNTKPSRTQPNNYDTSVSMSKNEKMRIS